MMEPADIASALGRVLARDLSGLKLLVTAGPTYEDLDPVRFFGNRSTGRMGFAIARQAALRGAEVLLVSGPVDLDTPRGVERRNVRSARELHAAVLESLDHFDALVMSAAVADYRPRTAADEKLKRGDVQSVDVELVQNPDILADVGARRQGKKPVLVGFALETGTDESVIAYAQGKLAKKKVDLVVANHASDSLGKEDNRVHFVTEGQVVSYPVSHKMAIADRLLDEVRELWQPGGF
jgi:phosphopantothenoylcysteine decarboxylase/phosphopantothenate--cysteine ligase